jgi:hypothetical protein
MALHQDFTLGIYPRRITITINHRLAGNLLNRADHEGRSLSNLCAFLLENAMEDVPTHAGGVEA